MPNLDSPFGCKCLTRAQHVTGDGCDECRPDLAAEFHDPDEDEVEAERYDEVFPFEPHHPNYDEDPTSY